MSLTTAILLNVLVGLGLIGSLLALLAYPGIREDRHHGGRLQRWHRDRAAHGDAPPKHVADG